MNNKVAINATGSNTNMNTKMNTNNNNTNNVQHSGFKFNAATKDILAGTCSGITTILLVHPFDTIRVRIQTNNQAPYTTIGGVIKQTYRREGLLAFYKGMLVPVLSQGLSKAVMFFSYGAARRNLEPYWNKNKDNNLPPISLLFVSGSISGICNCLVSSPIELIRSRLQVQYNRNKYENKYYGPLHVIKLTIKEHGIRGLFAGLLPMIYRDAPGVAAYYGIFEFTKRTLLAHTSNSTNNPNTNAIKSKVSFPPWQVMVSGACAGIGFWTFAFPQDTIKSIIQTRVVQDPSIAPGFFATGKQLIQNQGIGRLYRGFSIAIARGIPGASITFTTYSWVISYLNNNNW